MKALSSQSSRTTLLLAGACVTIIVTLAFLLLFWNRFVGLRSGDGGFTAGLMLLNGIVPYRDFYCPGPPLFLLRTATVLSLFGKTVIALRVAAIFERLTLAVILYAWLARFFKHGNAALAAIVTMVVSTLDASDPLSSYNHFTILMGVAAGFASSFALDEGRTPRSLLTIGAAAGALSFLCIACKQTIGLAITVALPIIIGACLLRLERPCKTMAFLGGFFAAWLAAMALLFSWFVHMGLLRIFLRQILITGPAAKASHPGDFLTRAIYVMRDMRWEAALGLIGFLICCGAVYRVGKKNEVPQERTRASCIQILGILFLGSTAIALSFKLPRHLLDVYLIQSPLGMVLNTYIIVRSLIYLALFGSAFLGLFYFFLYTRKQGLSRRQSQFLLFAAVSFSVAFMLSLSYPAFEAMTVPGLALFLAAMLEDNAGWRKWGIYVACTALLVVEIQAKLDLPFGFAGWIEPPVALANQTSTLPELKGMRLPATTVNFVDKTVRIIQQNSSPTDTIFIYPEFAFLYGASHRRPATFSPSHNIDVAPDSFCREEAARLLLNPPAVIVYGVESDPFLIGQEMLWRNGLPSGQRDIIAAVKTLTAQYKLAATFRPYAHDGLIFVYVRPASWRTSANRMQKTF
jgi:small basic protein